MIHDKFPKARHHALLIARDTRLQGPLDLEGPRDLPLLRHLKAVGERWAHGIARTTDSGDTSFKLGFHAVPSMKQLHLHVISTDYCSQGLKTKKHWLSFTHPLFFLDVDWVIEQLCSGNGAVGGVDDEEYNDGNNVLRLEYDAHEKEVLMKGALCCHRCGAEQKNMPQLKQHIVFCQNKFGIK